MKKAISLLVFKISCKILARSLVWKPWTLHLLCHIWQSVIGFCALIFLTLICFLQFFYVIELFTHFMLQLDLQIPSLHFKFCCCISNFIGLQCACFSKPLVFEFKPCELQSIRSSHFSWNVFDTFNVWHWVFPFHFFLLILIIVVFVELLFAIRFWCFNYKDEVFVVQSVGGVDVMWRWTWLVVCQMLKVSIGVMWW